LIGFYGIYCVCVFFIVYYYVAKLQQKIYFCKFFISFTEKIILKRVVFLLDQSSNIARNDKFEELK